MDNAVFPITFLKAVDSEGRFTGYASVYDVVDLQHDVVERGAFTRSIADRPTVKILFNHNANLPIGLGQLEDASAGLLLHGRLNLDLTTGREVYSNIKHGILDSLSIGYEVVKSARGAGGVRMLKELRVFEVSLVTFPANPAARVVDVKRKSSVSPLRLATLAMQFTAQAARMKTDMEGLWRRRWRASVEVMKSEVHELASRHSR